jgi:hypothetical protein
VAGVNVFKIYEYMWLETKAMGRTDLLAKLSHAEFIEVRIKLWCTGTCSGQQRLRMQNQAWQNHDLCFAMAPKTKGESDGITCQTGIDDYLEIDPGTKMTKKLWRAACLRIIWMEGIKTLSNVQLTHDSSIATSSRSIQLTRMSRRVTDSRREIERPQGVAWFAM